MSENNPVFADAGGWPGVLGRLSAKQDLDADLAGAALAEVLDGKATQAQTAAFAFGLRVKGETVEEITGLVGAMLAAAEPVDVPSDLADRIVDTCGTGGDRSGTINVSTLSALILAGAGVPVCKHGNRAASSQAGSADVLEALGVQINLGPAAVMRCVEEAGIGFFFAPRFHPALRHVGPVRKELGVATVFNVLGPLANPARVRRQVLGVGDPAIATKMVGVLGARGVHAALVVHGANGLDEISTTGISTVHEWRDGSVVEWEVDPTALGLELARLEDLQGANAETNAKLARRVLAGDLGPHRDIALLNAAAGLVAAGVANSIEDGLPMAAESIDSGLAEKALDRLIEVSRAQG